MVPSARGCSAMLAASLLVLWTGAADTSAQAPDPADALTDLRVSFKLDPRVSNPTYGGARWVSPPTFTSGAQEGTVGTVDARVQGVDATGRTVRVVPEWTAADTEMVTVTAGENDEFRITVKRAGESKVNVASRGVSRELVVKAKNLGKAIQVEIVQEPQREPRSATTPAPDPGAAVAAADASVLRDEKAKSSYALGMEMGNQLKQIREVDPDLVSRGLRDALTGDTPLLTEAEQSAALAAIRSEVKARQAESRKQVGAKNKKDGDAFLAANRSKEGVVTLPSGLQYKILKAGNGKRPTPDDTVVCHYRGTLIDGREFDSTHKRNKPATFALKGVIKGWSEALQLMPVGSRWQLFVPANLAYGVRGSRAGIGPNQPLVFEVELLSIKDEPSAESRGSEVLGRPN
jgi:FKBP-type peptidyl-prolyl cis-trans isomerase FklB